MRTYLHLMRTVSKQCVHTFEFGGIFAIAKQQPGCIFKRNNLRLQRQHKKLSPATDFLKRGTIPKPNQELHVGPEFVPEIREKVEQIFG